MKKIIRLLLILAVVNISAASSVELKVDPLIRYEKANQAYIKHQYKTAINLYTQVIAGGIMNGQIFYNLGNAYYKVGNIIEAKYYYEKASLFIPQDKDLRDNLILINRNFTDKAEDTRAYGLKVLDYLKNILSLNLILWMYAILFSLGTLMLYVHMRRVRLPGSIFIIYFSLSIMLVGFTYKRITYLFNPNRAIVWIDRVEVKSGPDNGLATLFILHQGSMLRIRHINKDWVNVVYNNTLNGWIKQRFLKVI